MIMRYDAAFLFYPFIINAYLVGSLGNSLNAQQNVVRNRVAASWEVDQVSSLALALRSATRSAGDAGVPSSLIDCEE